MADCTQKLQATVNTAVESWQTGFKSLIVQHVPWFLGPTDVQPVAICLIWCGVVQSRAVHPCDMVPRYQCDHCSCGVWRFGEFDLSFAHSNIGATTTGTGGYKSPQLLDWRTSNVLVPFNFLVERSFSSLRRLKTYLRNSMSQQRLNHLAVLHVHRDRLYSIDVDVTAREFVAKSENCLDIWTHLNCIAFCP